MAPRVETKNGYELWAAASALQKSIRRGEVKLAGFFACEIGETMPYYVWKRLMVISAEDIAGIVTQEIDALVRCWERIMDRHKPSPGNRFPHEGRLFYVKAAMLLAQATKNRDVDHLICFSWLPDDADVSTAVAAYEEAAKTKEIEIPDFAYDCHTIIGKRRGKKKKHMIVDEFRALKPRQAGLFDDQVETAAKHPMWDK